MNSNAHSLLVDDSPLLVISAHLDDAALSCGWLLETRPHSVIASLFTAVPTDDVGLTSWDRECGFRSSAEAMNARLEEDLSFVNDVRGTASWLGFLDGQYAGGETSIEAAVKVFTDLFAMYPRHILVAPMGLVHPDHLFCHRAAVQSWRQLPQPRQLFLYEDSPYRAIDKVMLERQKQIREEGLAICHRETMRVKHIRKSTLLKHYGSQLQRLKQHEVLNLDDCFNPEGFWQCVSTTSLT